MKHHSRLIIVMLGVLVAVFVMMPVSRVFAAVNYTAFDETQEKQAVQADPGGDLAQHLYCTEPFSAFTICMPTWNSNSGNHATLGVYKWDESYEKTISADPLYSKDFDCKDNANNMVKFNEPLPAGDYLFRIYNVVGVVGAYSYTGNNKSMGYMFVNGIESENEIQLTIRFENKTKTPFKAVDSAYGKYEGGHVAPEEYKIPADSLIYTHEVMPDTWVFTDELGRKSLTNAEVGDPRDNKEIALFYWTWHTSRELSVKVVNNQKIFEEYPELKNDYNSPVWKNAGNCNFWNEPIWGYYVTTDEWVLRKQVELLANAGVDAIFTDNTNGVLTWRESYIKLYETWTQAMNDGVKTPKVSFMLPFSGSKDARTQLVNLYQDIYYKNKYQNLWYYRDGKPMLMGWSSALDVNDAMQKDILDYFTFRRNIPEYIDPDSAESYGSWGWLSVYPQAYYYRNKEDAKENKVEQVTVGVSQNHDYTTHQLSAMNGDHITGRSYTKDLSHINELNAKLYGYNFSEQFDYALSLDPEVIFVTGWNEWTAGRNEEWCGVKNAFPDQFSDEFSRDLEPTRGDLRDNYYYLFVNYVRKYKGARAIPKVSSAKTIDLNAGQDQWKNVYPYYAAYIGNTGDRNHLEPGNVLAEDYSGRNDIIGAQISRDDDYLYFNVECKDNITSYTDSLWMLLYIDSDDSNQGWNTFDYVINKSAASEKTVVLEKFTGDGYNTTKVADCEYKVDGRYMTVKVKKSDINVSDGYTINFSWTDNVHDNDDKGTVTDGEVIYTTFSGDILDFYTSGDVAPGGRFKFSYISTNQMSEEQENNNGQPLPTEVPSGNTDSSSESGSNTAVYIIAVVVALAAVIVTVIVLKKK